MLRTLIRQELLVHLMSARFFAAVVTPVLLVVTNTYVLIGAHEARLADYHQREAVTRETVAAIPTYSFFRLKVERPPNPLSLFSAGLETRYGSTVGIRFHSVPFVSDAGAPLGLENPYLNLFSQLDLVFIFQVVLSLLALLFAYDAIAGELETGTLRLVLSHPVGRGTVLFAKYLAAMGCLLLPVFMSLLLALIQCSLAPTLHLSPADFLRIGGIFLTTVVYLSVFYLIGLLISTTTRRAATSLMLCLFVWVVLVLVYPNWSRFTLNPVGEMRAEKSAVDRQIAQIRESLEREERRFLDNSPLEGKPPAFPHLFTNMRWAHGDYFYRIQGDLKDAADPMVPHYQRFHAFFARQRIRSAEKIGLVRQQLGTQQTLRQAQWDERLMKLSPASLYTFATSAWAGTDVATMVDYVRAAQAYRRTLLDYFEDKAAFTSLHWFATNQGKLDWTGLPRFRFERAAVGINFTRALPALFFLCFTNFVLFMVTFLIFRQMEV